MIDINTYILEKLNISKDTDVEDKEIYVLANLYEIGDRCLLLKLKNKKVMMDVVEITRLNVTKINYKAITHVAFSLKEYHMPITRKFAAGYRTYKAAWYKADSKVILPYRESKELLKEIENNNLKLKNFKNVYTIEQEDKVDNYTIVETIDKVRGEYWDDNLKPITQESFNEIKKALGV